MLDVLAIIAFLTYFSHGLNLKYLPSVSFFMGAVAKTEASTRCSGATAALDLEFWSFRLPTFWDPFFWGKTLLISRCLVAMLGAETYLTSLIVILNSTDDSYFAWESDGDVRHEYTESWRNINGNVSIRIVWDCPKFMFVAFFSWVLPLMILSFFPWSTPRWGIQLSTTYLYVRTHQRETHVECVMLSVTRAQPRTVEHVMPRSARAQPRTIFPSDSIISGIR